MSRSLELAFTPQGTAELQDADTDTVIWSSDEDDDFKDEFGDEMLSADEDSDDVLQYLLEQHHITEAEFDAVEVFEETAGDTIKGESDEN